MPSLKNIVLLALLSLSVGVQAAPAPRATSEEAALARSLAVAARDPAPADTFVHDDEEEFEERDLDEFEERDLDEFEERDLDEFEERDLDEFDERNLEEFDERDLDEFEERDFDEFEERDLEARARVAAKPAAKKVAAKPAAKKVAAKPAAKKVAAKPAAKKVAAKPAAKKVAAKPAAKKVAAKPAAKKVAAKPAAKKVAAKPAAKKVTAKPAAKKTTAAKKVAAKPAAKKTTAAKKPTSAASAKKTSAKTTQPKTSCALPKKNAKGKRTTTHLTKSTAPNSLEIEIDGQKFSLTKSSTQGNNAVVYRDASGHFAKTPLAGSLEKEAANTKKVGQLIAFGVDACTNAEFMVTVAAQGKTFTETSAFRTAKAAGKEKCQELAATAATLTVAKAKSIFDAPATKGLNHGDLNAGNVFFDDAVTQVETLIDWGSATTKASFPSLVAKGQASTSFNALC